MSAAVLAFIAGVPLITIFWFSLVLACPLMMFFMMRGGHQQDGQPKAPEETVVGRQYPPGVH